ncbi:hypothetical protein C5B27_10185 [Neisseria gonorrhoeae]|nr:hypothetical protein C5B26_10645 [Neisseria gonorrhoeae]PPZ88306.1 hypothetical protein C5B27_10185 [Neisseria gonorrhoeae]
MLPTVSDGIFYTIPAIFHHSRQHRNLETRHSRAGGNLDLSVQELIGQNGFLRFSVLDSHFRGNDNS